MRAFRSRTLWGILLVVVGVLFLLESLQVLALGGAWAALFVAAGLIFGYAFFEKPANWWAAIPGMSLLSIGVLVGADALFPRLAGSIGGSIILGGIALSFWIVYLRTRFQHWWAIIPGGILGSLALGLAAEPFIAGEAFVGIFFTGMALTFLLVYLLPTAGGNMAWSLIPAGILGAMGLIFLSVATRLMGVIWPVALIGLGVYVLFRALRR